MTWRRSVALPLALAATLLPWVAGAGAASAATSQAHVRLIYLSPDGGNVDFTIDGRRAWSNVAYKTVSTYVSLAASQHDFQVRASGSSPATSPALAEVRQALAAGSYSTVFAGGKSSDLRAGVFTDGITTPPQGKAEARFIHMAPEVPGVDVALKNGPVLFSNISLLQSSSYAAVAAGSYDFELRATGTDTVLFSTSAVVSGPGTVHTLIGAGGVGQPVELLQVLDAASAVVSPNGGATTGAGGLAPGGAVSLGLIAFMLLGSACLLLLGRRSRLPT